MGVLTVRLWLLELLAQDWLPLTTTPPVPLIVPPVLEIALKVSPPEPMVREFVAVLTVTPVIEVPAGTAKARLWMT